MLGFKTFSIYKLICGVTPVLKKILNQGGGIALFFLLYAPSLNGALLVDPSDGTVTVLYSDSGNHDDQVTTGRSLGFTGAFFGDTKTTVDVSTNGNLNFSGNSDPTTTALPNATASISPFWADLAIEIGDGASIIESVSPGSYYALTWDDVQFPADDTARMTCQVVWFGSTATVGGCTFQANDIVFSYDKTAIMNFDTFRDPIAGLNKGDSTNFASIPGTADGSVTSLSLLPDSFIVFRTSGSTYSVTTGCPPGSGVASGGAFRNRDLYQTDLYTSLVWEPSSGFTAANYRIYRDGGLIATVGAALQSYQDHNLRSNTLYTYEIVAVNSSNETMSIDTFTVRTLEN